MSKTGRYSIEYRERVLHIARSLENPTCETVLDAAGSDYDGRQISRNGLWQWLKAEGITLAGTMGRYPANIRDQAVALVNVDGLSVWGARKRLIATNGNSPSVELIARWTGTQYEHHKPELDEPGDSWQRAWTAAEGKTGAAWAETVMRHWLPDIERNSDEQRMRKADAKRRKEAREQTESAPGRRMAA